MIKFGPAGNCESFYNAGYKHTYEAPKWLKEIGFTKKHEISQFCMRCEEKLKEVAGVTSRCIPFEQEEIADTCVCCGKKAKSMLYWGKAY